MEAPKNTFSELFGLVRSWFTWRSDPDNVSRDFWMPDKSCRVCYECDSQFSIVIRKHHCRHCGRVFCGRCTRNTVPVPCSAPKALLEEQERVRVCNYCFEQWEKQSLGYNNNGEIVDLEFITSPSRTSFSSPKSTSPTSSGTLPLGSMSNPVGLYHQNSRQSSDLNFNMSRVKEKSADSQGTLASGTSNDIGLGRAVPSQEQLRSDEDDDDDIDYQSDTETKHYQKDNNCNNRGFVMSKNVTKSGEAHFDSYKVEEKTSASQTGDEGEVSSSIYAAENINVESVDFENNGLIWLPPEPEDEDDEKEDFLYEGDDDEGSGEWGCLRTSSSFGSGEYQNRDCSSEEQQNLMKNVVYGHFRALIAQLLQVENISMNDENSEESWLDIISSLSWEAASLLKPDTSRSGGMDPGGYVKVKCLASGRRCQSMLVKGVVCKKNVAHRRMTSNIDRPRILILGGALEYQRVSNLLSSFDTLLQQEMDHLKMAVAKIDAHQPDVLLVENSVSRYAQDYLLDKDISLVLNIKKSLLDRIARCTGAEKVPSVDHISSEKLGFCEKFHVERFQEDHGSAGQGGRKLMKTLMFFEGCPRPQAFTILLRGANGDELKKLKHVAQYGLFAAYHLGLETSFLADERASLPELPLKSPINVALPDKSIERSISMVPGFGIPNTEKARDLEPEELQRSSSVPLPVTVLPPDLPNGPCSQSLSSSSHDGTPQFDIIKKNKETICNEYYVSGDNNGLAVQEYHSIDNGFVPPEGLGSSAPSKIPKGDDDVIVTQQVATVECATLPGETKNPADETGPLKEEFSSEHQSILVSLSSRCVWNGTVCERSHLFRIKYYGSFDKPLGRFLRDHLFDQNYQCHSCNMPSEAHVHCYTHRQGTLAISVRKLDEFFLPGEAEGKIWMWHRCLQCPRANGFPPATRRVIMSDAAWGLSFGKFLELSFSNHAAASRVASCGHSLHRDCLRFYGFSNMVACFRYASIDVLSVYLPPATLDMSYGNQNWIQKEADEVVKRAELLFSEVLKALSQISKKKHGSGQPSTGTNPQESTGEIADLEGMLQKEKMEFDEALQKTMNREGRKGQLMIDILEINRLRRQLLFQSIMWDHLLVNAANHSHSPIVEKEKPLTVKENEISASLDAPLKPEVTLARLASDPVDGKFGKITNNTTIQTQIKQPEDSQGKLSASAGVYEHGDPLELGSNIRRALSDGQIPVLVNLSETFDAAWTGESHPKTTLEKDDSRDHSNSAAELIDKQSTVVDEQHGLKPLSRSVSLSSPKAPSNAEDSVSWFKLSFLSFYRSVNKNVYSSADNMLSEYKPAYVTFFRESDLQSGARLLLPVGVNDTVIPVYDDEPTSIISYALASCEYSLQLSGDTDKLKDAESFSSFSTDSTHLQSMHSLDDTGSESTRSLGSTIDEGSLYRSSSGLDPLPQTKDLHAKVSFSDDGPHGKAKYSVTCYFARRFEALRRICCPSEMDYIRCLTRCKKWGAQGGKSNVFFAKTLDDRFIIKQVTKTELESFFKFAPAYFKYLSESIDSGSPTCLAKILGIYQVISKHVKGGRESKMDVLVMENLLYKRNVIRLYDLKGSSRSRYNPDSNGSNKVLLDQNLIEAMPTCPIFVGNKAKRLLERAVWNDTSFLASVDVMDYSLLVGVDGEKHELVLGIIDFMRQYTLDKHLETWVKASGLLGGPKNASPTIISPKQYKKRFRKAMTTYFLMVPDQWSPPTLIPSKSQSDLQEETTQPVQE